MKGPTALAACALMFCCAAAQAAHVDGEPPKSVLLEDFERDDAPDDWSTWQVELTLFDRQPSAQETSRAARLLYPKWAFWRGKWPAAILHHGDGQFRTNDWSLYSALRFEARANHTRTVHLKLRIDDGSGRRATRIIPIEAGGWSSYAISLAGLADDIDTRDVRRVDLYMSQPAATYSIDLDNLRLETAAIAIQEAELLVDPFERRSLVVNARFNQRATWRVVVTSSAGQTVAEYNGNGMSLALHEILPLLPPGRYGVTLSLLPAHHGSGVERRLGSLAVVEEPEWVEPMVAWVTPSTQKVLLHDLPEAGQTILALGVTPPDSVSDPPPIRLAMARGETEAFQLVFRTQDRPANIRVEAGPIEHVDGGGGFAGDAVAFSRVLYVDAQEPEEYSVSFSGWWPDPLVPGNDLVVAPDQNAPLWIALKSSVDQRPGLYRGEIQVHVDGQTEPDAVALEVLVYPVTVSQVTTTQTAFSFYESSLSQVYGDQRAQQLLPLYRQFIGDHRLNVTNIYTGSPPEPEVLVALRERRQLNRFVALYVETREYDTEALADLAQVLDPYMAEYKRLGLATQAIIYGFDEAHSHQFADLKTAFTFLKQRYPEVKTATTAVDPSLGMDTGLDEVVDIWIPLTAYYDPETAAAARAGGAQVWWYTCIAPIHPHANWFIEYPALEARLLWWMSHRQRVDGFLYWTLNRWPGNERPLQVPQQGNKVEGWNSASFGTANGDGCLLYPASDGPLSSIRLENIRDGIEDLELLRALAGDDATRADMLCDEVASAGITGFTRDHGLFAQTRANLLKALSPFTDQESH